jgi:hypothetical protein
VFILTASPILIYKYEHKPITKTGLTISALMWIAVFGGYFFFTQVVHFDSPHFDHSRPLTIIECTYVMSQVLTTVGYGDIVPSNHRGQLFVGLYVVLAFFVIALLISEMQQIVVSQLEGYKDGLADRLGFDHAKSGKSSGGLHLTKPTKPYPDNVVISAIFFLLVAVLWILFFHYWPGEEKPWSDATYMALITLATVGFGAVTPSTEGGMVFASFFMFIGSAALVAVVSNFSSYLLHLNAWESWDPDAFQEELEELQATFGNSITDEITELDYFTFTLIHKGILTSEQVAQLKRSYKIIHRKSHEGGSGKVNINFLRSFTDSILIEPTESELTSSARSELKSVKEEELTARLSDN